MRKLHPLGLLLTGLVLAPIACERADSDVGNDGGDGDAIGEGGAGTGGNPIVGDGDNVQVPNTGGTISGTGGTPPIVLPNPLVDTCANNSMGMGGIESVGDAEGPLLIDDFEDGDNQIWGNGLSGHWESHGDTDAGQAGEGAEGSEGAEQSPLGGRHHTDKNWIDDVVTTGGANPGTQETFVTGREGGNGAHFTGHGYGSWGSGQSVYFAKDDDDDYCIYDASAFAGITFWARGTVELTDPENAAAQPKPEDVGKLRVHVVERDVVPNSEGGECDQETKDCWDAPKARVEVQDCWAKYVLTFADLERDGWSKHDSGVLDANELYQLVFEVSEHQTYDVLLDDVEFFTSDDVPAPVTCTVP